MLGQVKYERGAWGTPEWGKLYGLPVLRACADPVGRLGEFRLGRAGRSLIRSGVARVLVPRDFDRWPLLEKSGLSPVNPEPLVRHQGARLALEGLRVALDTGFDKIKINAVLIGGFNDGQIRDLAELTRRYPVDMRFIEMMPMYDNPDFNEGSYLPCAKVLDELPELQPVEEDGSVAKLYRLPDAQGNVGLISPLSAHFCSACNRIRLTADGKLKPCLHSGDEYSLKGLDFDGMKAMLEEVIRNKPAWHGDLDAAHLSQAGRTMNQIGG